MVFFCDNVVYPLVLNMLGPPSLPLSHEATEGKEGFGGLALSLSYSLLAGRRPAEARRAKAGGDEG